MEIVDPRLYVQANRNLIQSYLLVEDVLGWLNSYADFPQNCPLHYEEVVRPLTLSLELINHVIGELKPFTHAEYLRFMKKRKLTKSKVVKET